MAPYTQEIRRKGLPLSEGCSVGRICMFNDQRHNDLPSYTVSNGGIKLEIDRLEEAVQLAAGRLDEVREKVREGIGPAEAEIFVAQRMILEDPELYKEATGLIRDEGANAEAAVSRVFDAYEQRLLSLDAAYIRERASDFGEVKRRLLDALSNTKPSLRCNEGHCQHGRNRIVAASELTPAMTVELEEGHTMGFVAEYGGRNSHAAILARALGVPAVSGITGVYELLSCGTEVMLDGTTGELVVNPSEQTVREAAARRAGAMRLPTAVSPTPGLTVMANISVAAEADDAKAMEAEGIGLYRTEMELILAGKMLSEDEQYERYLRVTETMADNPVIFRMLDVGSDKALPFISTPEERNPALGWRGGRFLLGQTSLLATQARALARLSQKRPIDVIYPMVVDCVQFRALRDAFEDATRDIECGTIRQGIMFEVPSACLEADEILAEAELASIGTNDLIQYLFAVDRDNGLVAKDFHADRKTLWDLIARIAEAARKHKRPLSLCGEVASDPAYLSRLLDVGIQTVSLNTRQIPAVRSAFASLSSGAKIENADDIALIPQ